MSTSQATLLQDFVREFGLGRAGKATADGTTTTLIDNSNFSSPSPGGEFPNASPIRITSGTDVGVNVFKSGAIDPSTGTITFTPAQSSAPGTNATFVISNIVEHIDRLIEAINRGLSRRCSRWVKVPLTDIPDGDFLGGMIAGAISDNWTGTNATLAYTNLTMANGFAQTVGQVTTSSANGSMTSKAIPVEAGESRNFMFIMRNANSSGTTVNTAQAKLHDVTNTAVITPTFVLGAATTASHGFIICQGSYTVPSGCSQIQWEFIGQENGAVVQFGNVIDCGVNQRNWAMQPHLSTEDDIQTWSYVAMPPTSTSGPQNLSFLPLSDDGVSIQDYGWGLGVEWDYAPPFPVFYDEYMFFPQLTSDTDTTNADEELVLLAAAIELYSMFTNQSSEKPTFYRGRVLPTATMLKLQNAQERWSSPRVARLRAPRRVTMKRTYGRMITA